VLLGTLYPLAVDAMGAGKISVGAPYFGLLFTLLLAPLVLALPYGMFARFKRDDLRRLTGLLRWPLVLAVGLPLIGYGLIFNLWLCVLGGLLTAGSMYAWALEPEDDPNAAHEHHDDGDDHDDEGDLAAVGAGDDAEGDA